MQIREMSLIIVKTNNKKIVHVDGMQHNDHPKYKNIYSSNENGKKTTATTKDLNFKEETTKITVKSCGRRT